MPAVSLIISLLSLAVSLMSFYFVNLRSYHSLQMTLQPIVGTGEPGMTVATFGTSKLSQVVVFPNTGNRDEVILSLSVSFSTFDGGHVFFAPVPPFVVKASEVVTQILMVDTDNLRESLSSNSNVDHSSTIGLRIQPLLPDGKAPIRYIDFSNVEIDAPVQPTVPPLKFKFLTDDLTWSLIRQDSFEVMLARLSGSIETAFHGFVGAVANVLIHHR